MKRVVLVALDWTRDRDPRVPLGHASVLAGLRRHADLDVRAVVLPVNPSVAEPTALAASLRDEAGVEGTIAFGVYVWNEAVVQSVLPALRSVGFRGRVVLGGPQISYAPAGVAASYPHADAFVRGPGEEVLGDVVRAVHGAPLLGVAWRGLPDPATQATADLDRAPSPWLTGATRVRPGGLARMETQRGCVFRCSFCQHREPDGQARPGRLPLGRIRDELDLFVDSGVAEIAVLDPIFNTGPHATQVLRHLRERGFTGRVNLQCRFESLDEVFLDACAGLDVVLELGLQTIHPEEGRAIRRVNRLDRVDAAIAAMHARRIPFLVSLIYALPAQTLASFEASVQWCLDRGVPVIRAFPLLLLRGTPLADEPGRWGMAVEPGEYPLVRSTASASAADIRAMAGISQGLRETEGRHPPTVGALRREATDQGRFVPPSVPAGTS